MPRVKKNSKAVVPKEVEEEEDEVELLKGKIANNIPDRGSQLTRYERDNYADIR
jgi:hypothetical protein